MKPIELKGRYGRLHKLVHIKNNRWKLEIDPNGGQCMSVHQKEGTIYSIDPDGGPFLSVGDKIKKYTITKITNEIGEGTVVELTKM